MGESKRRDSYIATKVGPYKEKLKDSSNEDYNNIFSKS